MFTSSLARWLARSLAHSLAHSLALWPAAWALAANAEPAPLAAASTDAAPVFAYRSTFEGYVPFADEKPIQWKAANDTVQRRGGWQTYARETTRDAHGDSGHAPPRTPPSSSKGRP